MILFPSLSDRKPSYDLLLKYLATFPPNAPVPPETAAHATRAILTAIRTEAFFAFEDLLPLPPIQNLRGTPIFDLLSIFLNDDLAAYLAFHDSHEDFFAAEPSLSHEANVRKIRLLSLASLGSSNVSRELPYATIAATLQVSQEDVEMWVIDVIRAGLVEARINQLSETVTVHRSIYRVFGREQWQQLGARLAGWKQSLAEILAVVGNAKLIATSSQGGIVLGNGSAEVKVETGITTEV